MATVDGDNSNNLLFGTAADDILNGFDGNDELTGFSGADTLNGGAGDDSFVGEAGNDVLNGGTGIDQILYNRETGTSGVNVDLQAGTAIDTWGNTDTLISIERVYGSVMGDTLTGTNSGNDFLFGRSGDDILNSGAGGGTLVGDAGNDTLNGGAGFDQIAYFLETGASGVTVDMLSGIATDTWGNTDRLISIEYVFGTARNDTILGSNRDGDRIFGGDGNDFLNGRDGNNLIFTGSGNDLVIVGTTIKDARDTVVIDGIGHKTITGTDATGSAYGHHIVFRPNEAVIVNMATGTASSANMTVDFSQALYFLEVGGSAFNDLLIGGNRNHDNHEWYVGNQGNDTINGATGTRDTIVYDDEVLYGSFNAAIGVNEYGTHGAVVNLGTGTATDTFGFTDTLINIDSVRGTRFVDSITGSSEDNFFWGLAGNDMLNGGTGQDSVFYGEDYLTGGTFGVTVDLASGFAIDGFGNRDVLISIENAYGSNFGDSLTGDGGDNRLFGYDGADTLRGGAGNDIMLGGAGSDAIDGGSGDDEIWGEAGADTLNGGLGSDMVRYLNAAAAVTVDLAAGTATDGFGFTDRLISIEQAHGSQFDDVLRGSAAANRIFGNDGNDVILGGGGADTLSGGNGADSYTFSGGDGYDIVNDLGQSLGGDDRIIFNSYLASNASIYRQNPLNESIVLDFGATGDVVVAANTLNGAHPGAVEWFQFADGTLWDHAALLAHLGQVGTRLAILPTAGNDVLFGTSGSERIDAAAGNDLVNGLGGNDVLVGGNGFDTLRGGDGADTLNGGIGNDSIFGGDTAADLRDVIYGGDGNDWVDAGYGNDQVFGGNGNDTVDGGMGADEITGQAGDDVLTGSAFSDLIFGGDGADFINGGFGNDRLNGGAGADRFYHLGVAGHGSDWVQDYRAAEADVLLAGINGAVPSQFQVNLAETAGAGAVGVQEAFVIYRPTGQILWALVDGGAETHINLQIGAQVFDLLV